MPDPRERSQLLDPGVRPGVPLRQPWRSCPDRMTWRSAVAGSLVASLP
jgi:hypothetical protein